MSLRGPPHFHQPDCAEELRELAAPTPGPYSRLFFTRALLETQHNNGHQPHVQNSRISMGNNISQNHHFVPQLLLRGFTNDDGALWVYDTEQQRKWAVADTKSAGAENDFHTINLKSGVKDRTSIERLITENIDSPGADAISGLLNRECLDAKRWNNFLRFVAHQMMRTPAALQMSSDLMAPTLQEAMERMARHDATFRERVSKRLLGAGVTVDDIEKLLQTVGSGTVKLRPHRDLAFLSSLATADVVENNLGAMHWTFLSVAEDEPDLMIGDHPVTLRDVGPDSMPPGPLGIRNPNIEICVPLSKRMAAFARWDGPNNYGRLQPGMSGLINETTMQFAKRFIYGPCDSEELLANAVRLRGTGPKVHVKRIKTGKGLIIASSFH